MTGIENVDFVTCKICDAKFVSLAKHITGTHGLTKEQYLSEHGGQIKCDASTKRYSNQNKINCDWISRAKENGGDLTAYRMKMGAAVSKAILSNPKECARRAQTMSDNNKTDEAKARSSRVARVTSLRPEIQEQRSKNLERWREENPNEFQKCIDKMMLSGCSTSKPQREIHKLILTFKQMDDFILEYRKKHPLFKTTRSNRRYFDMCSEKNKIVVEFDGRHHFKEIFKNQNIELNYEKDKELNEVLPNLGYCFIRISYDQWLQRGRFKGECVGKLYDIILDAQPGLYFIGDHHAGE